jgi:imidazole glycerol-phosphate synthase subunit HisF
MMMRTRVIPCLLIANGRLVKTIRFKNPTYVGDPINIVRIFNHKEVDEIVFLDINATIDQKPPPFELIDNIASECFMPLAYGGGIHSMEHVKRLFQLGVEKVILNAAACGHEDLVPQIADCYGSQSVVVSMDVKKNLFGQYRVYINSGRSKVAADPLQYAKYMQLKGAGEILLTAIHCDGTMQGYDIPLINRISHGIDIPLIASGGAGALSDLVKAVQEGGASAVAVGSMVVYQGKNRSVLTRFPKREELEMILP